MCLLCRGEDCYYSMYTTLCTCCGSRAYYGDAYYGDAYYGYAYYGYAYCGDAYYGSTYDDMPAEKTTTSM